MGYEKEKKEKLAVTKCSLIKEDTIPSYDFRCPRCAFKLMDVHGVPYDHIEKCNMCGTEMKRLIGPVGFQFSDKSSLPPTASSKFNMSMRQKNFKKRLEAHEKLNKPVPDGANVKKRYFGMEDDGPPRDYRPPTMKDMDHVESSIRKKRGKIITT